MDAALNPKARPTARERCASAFSSEALRIFLGVVLGGAVGVTVAALCPEDRCAASAGRRRAAPPPPSSSPSPAACGCRALKCVVLPLICCNVTLSASELKKQAGVGKIGRWLVSATTCSPPASPRSRASP